MAAAAAQEKAPTSLAGHDDMTKLKNLSSFKYKQQAVWFLNGYWEELNNESERIFQICTKMMELDEKNGVSGCELDEFTSHRFLEQIEETQTVRQMREMLKEVDIDTNNRVSLAEYLIFHYKVDWHELIFKPQGDNSEEVARAQALVTAAQRELEAARETAHQATVAAREARESAEAARKKTAESRQAEAALKIAEEEVRAALSVVEAEQAAYDNKKAALQAATEVGGMVSRNKAKNELAQLLNEDPLPLARAKITQQAAVRKSEKATKAAAAARQAAEAAEAAAEQAKADSEAAAAAAEEAKRASEKSMAEAIAFLEEAKSHDGVAHGAIWWMQRELEEARKYLPQSRGGIAKS